MTSRMSEKKKTGLIVVLIVIACLTVGAITALWAMNFRPNPRDLWEQRTFPLDKPSFSGDFEVYYTAKTVISSVNITLVSILLGMYVSLYRKSKSTFVLALLLLALVLLLYALVSNPLVMHIFGFRGYGLGPFAMLPDLFATISLCILLYLSLK